MWSVMTFTGTLPGGATRVAAVIGTPIKHSLSPLILNAAFQAVGLDWVYTAFEVPVGSVPGALDAMRVLDLGGLSVTMPHKADACAAVDERTREAEMLGAVNCVAWQGNQLVGHSTDGPGFIDALRVDAGWDPAGRRCLVLGAGGAARAVIVSLSLSGASEVIVVNRTPERGAAAAALGGPEVRVGSADEVDSAELIVDATPLGMAGHPTVTALHPTADESSAVNPLPFDPERIGPGQLVVDLVYHPLQTSTLIAAEARGAVAVNGLGMLIHQAAHAFRLWTGEDPPLEAMSAAVVAELARRQH